MKSSRQSPAYALFAQAWLPCSTANPASASSGLTMEYPAPCLISPAYESKSADNLSKARLNSKNPILCRFMKDPTLFAAHRYIRP